MRELWILGVGQQRPLDGSCNLHYLRITIEMRLLYVHVSDPFNKSGLLAEIEGSLGVARDTGATRK